MTDTHEIVIIVSFALYTLAIVGVGLWSSVFARDSDEDFFLAGRSLGPWVGALSASASSESGWVTLGLVGMAYANGVKAYWIIPGCLLGYLFNWFILAGRMNDRARELEAVTIPDFFSRHFRERLPILRLISVAIILTAMLAYVSGQLAAGGKAFEATFASVDYRIGVLLGAAIVLLYTVSGGFRAVCWTDFLQALLMVGTLVIFPAYLLLQAGGYGEILPTLHGLPANEGGGDLTTFWPQLGAFAALGFLLGHSALGINFGYPGQPHVLVRFMALRNRREARIGGLVAFTWGLLVYWGAVTVGLYARMMAETGAEWTAILATDQEMSLVAAAANLLPGVLGGLVLAAVLAAICSTADSQLVVAASAVASDIYARLINRQPGRAHTLVNRAVVALLGIGAVLMVLDSRVQVYKYILTYGWAMLGASFGPQLILALLWRANTYAGCVAGMLTGFAVAILWPQIYNEAETGVHIYNLPVAFLAATVINVLVSSMTRPRQPTDADQQPQATANT